MTQQSIPGLKPPYQAVKSTPIVKNTTGIVFTTGTDRNQPSATNSGIATAIAYIVIPGGVCADQRIMLALSLDVSAP